MSYQRNMLLTGFPGFLGRRIIQKMLSADTDLQATLLVESSQRARAAAVIDEISEMRPGLNIPKRVRIIEGDITSMDLGMSGPEYESVVASTTEIYHLAAIHELRIQKNLAEQVNVFGTKNILSFARTVASLERFVYFSSAYVSGDREGVILEEELESGQGFRNIYEATKHRAEVLVRRASYDLPVTIVRPAGVVGDSQTGEIDRYDEIYHLGLLLATGGTRVPLSGSGRAPLNLVPVDYVIDALHVIVNRPETVGKTFHLCDPNPLSVRGVYDAVAEEFGNTISKYSVSPSLTKALLRIPGVERFAPKSREIIDYLNHMAFYHSGNTADALEGTGIRCPRFESYVGNLVEFVREKQEQSTT
ncbi:MAG: SDR family oxidoreductase [Myxococcota bacterium]|nr:SDR family oxidoreductase [Myxococcota bacterium]